jgi:tRNA(fMet)-specific endonuclease VapC
MAIYVLDTNICIFYLRGNQSVADTMQRVGYTNLYISEITIIELLEGAEKSGNTARKEATIALINRLKIVPIKETYEYYVSEKIRLSNLGTPVDNFDLLIAAAALRLQAIMVTNNTKHFERIQNIVLEDWYIR